MGIEWNRQGYFLGKYDNAKCHELREIVTGLLLDPRDFDPARKRYYEEITFFPRFAATERMRALGTELAAEAFKQELMVCRSAQVALRFPGCAPVPWHVDKIAAHGAALYKGSIDHHFKTDAILGLYLSNVTLRTAPLTLAAESHGVCEAFAKEHGFKTLRRGVLPNLESCEKVSIVGEPGTAIMMHPLMAHHVPTNESSDIRFALYFRMKKVGR